MWYAGMKYIPSSCQTYRVLSVMNFKKNGKDNEKKALVKVLEIDSNGNFLKKILGFGIKLRKDKDKNTFMFLTSSSVLSPLGACQGSRIVVERFCSKYPKHMEDHREEVYKVVSSVDDNVSFAFYEGKSEDGFLEVDDGSFHERLPMYGSLNAYAFDGKDIVELTFGKDSSMNYRLTSVSKEEFQVCNAKGAPIIFYDPLSEKPMIVGILHITSDGHLYPVFLTRDKLNVKRECPPKDEENGSKPVGESDKPETDKVDSGSQPRSEDAKPVLVVTGITKQKDKISGNVVEGETKCFKYKTIDEELPHKLKIELQMRLDPERPYGGDIQSLAEAFGYNQTKITYLKSLKHPTQVLLVEKGASTLVCLSEKLTEIGRGDDVAVLIDDYIRKNCGCIDCPGSLQ